MLLARLLPGINSVLQLNNHLKLTFQSHSALAEKGISQVISCLQNQLNLLAVETQQNFKSVFNKTEALQASTGSFQQTMEQHCTNAVESANSQQNKFESSADNLIKEIRQASSEGVKVIEESSGYCTHLSTAVASLSKETEKWCSSTNSNIVSFADRQLSFLNGNRSLVQNLQQDVVRSCDSLSTEVTDQIRGQQGSAESALSALLEQVGSDKEMLMDHKIELGDQAQEGLHEVLRFLQEELKQDVPTESFSSCQCLNLFWSTGEPLSKSLRSLQQRSHSLAQ
ncbi:UNVERIFIED_CONTAM: hypothetical protein FKN15_022172 [Acipenser sinensis]